MGYQVYQDSAARDLGVTRWAGYGVPAVCDQPGCETEIDRGLGYRCGDATDDGCGLSFCSSHLYIGGGDPQMCERCCDQEQPFTPKPDTAEWELTSPKARADAAKALPGLMLASAMGDERATAYASQIIGQNISDALQPSVQAMRRLASYRAREVGDADD